MHHSYKQSESQKSIWRGGGGGGGGRGGGRGSQMTSHCNGNATHSKTSTSLSVCLSVCLSVSSPAVFCHNPSYVTASRCTRSFRFKELSE